MIGSVTRNGGNNQIWSQIAAKYGQASDQVANQIANFEKQVNKLPEKNAAQKAVKSTIKVFVPIKDQADINLGQLIEDEQGLVYTFGQIVKDKIKKQEGKWRVTHEDYVKEWNVIKNLNDLSKVREYFGLSESEADTAQAAYVLNNINVLRALEEAPELIRAELKGQQFSLPELFQTFAKRSSPAVQFGGFVIAPLIGQQIFGAVRPLVEGGQMMPAQLAAIAGLGLTSVQSFLISDSVCRHLNFDHLNNKYLDALIPFVKLGTVLSHNLSPLLRALGFAVNFEGEIGAKESNIAGKGIGFVNNILELLRPASMLGFALSHWSGYNRVKGIDGHQGAMSRRFELFGFWANIVGFGAWSVSQVASMFIENHMSQVAKKYEPVLAKIQEAMMTQQEALKQAVITGKMSKEQAIQILTKLEEEAQNFLKTQVMPAYKKDMQGWETAQWFVNVVNWASFLGINAQMLTQRFRQTLLRASSIQDDLVSKGESKIGWHKAYWKAAQGDNPGNSLQAGALAVSTLLSPLALVFSTTIDGIATLFGNGSPIAKDGPPELIEKIRRNPIYSFAQSVAMFG